MKSVEAKPIARLIKGLKIGQSESWPIVQLSSVRITVNRIQLQHQRKFSTSTNGKYITVTRLPDENLDISL